MTDPTSVPWGTIVAGGAAAFVSILTSVAALLVFVVKLLKENAKLKTKRKQLVRSRRLTRIELERTKLGQVSVAPPPIDDDGEYSDDSAVIDVFEVEDDRFDPRGPLRIDPMPLEAFSGKRRLPRGAGQEDYIDHELDRQSRGYQTPEALNRDALMREEVTPREIPRPPSMPRFDGSPLPPYRKKLPSRKD